MSAKRLRERVSQSSFHRGFARRASLLATTLGAFVCVGLVACSKKAPDGDLEPIGIPAAQPNETPLIAGEEGNGPAAVGLLPLEVGNTWKYRVTGSSTVCTPGEHTRAILRTADVGGKQAFISSGFCGNDQETTLSPEGTQVLQYTDGEWRTSLASRLVENRAWDFSDTVSYHWHKVGWVRVAAGLFSDCWERAPLDNSWAQIYCDGAGMVSMSAEGLLVELVSFNLNHGTLVSRASRSRVPG